MDWLFSEKAAASIRESTSRLNFWHGSVRSGKTISSIIRWITFIASSPADGHLLMVGKTERTLKRNVLDEIERIVGSRAYKHIGGAGEVWIHGRRVLLVGANDARAESKVRGLTLAGVYVDEMSLIPEPVFRQLTARMSVRGAMLFGTTNPDGPYHWLKTAYLDRADLDMRLWHFGLDDNPALDASYVANLKVEYGEGSLWYKRFILGLWVAAEGAVYDFFNEREHTLLELPDRAPDQLDLSVDYGTSNATSVGAYLSWNGVPDAGLRAVRHSGWYYDGRATGRQKTDSEYGQEIAEWAKGLPRPVRHVFLDPSAASLKTELKRRGFSVRSAKNDVIDGIRTQAKMLRNGEYRIRQDASNAECIRDYGAYLWDTRAQARGEDKPLKANDHTKDEERYYLHTIFGQPQRRAPAVSHSLSDFA
ncbi:MAG: PBSX family phage terminase large subunit [Gemmatimonadaceae bacterium]|nr:PBSX family phage terminase large subunit [Gemmatimonadaceae bacterium]